ncbi:MAG: glucosamine-6-phosphate deaminase [Acholeplasma sp.]|nr:MAG: glucosamine-6-phosphate deaminase [Acholeplasma sp.]
MNIIICRDYSEISDQAAQKVITLLKSNPYAKLGLATGSSPIGLYERLVKAYRLKEISFKDVMTFNLDEYVGIPRSHSQSYYSFMNEHLFKHIDIQLANIHIPDNDIERIDEIAKEYNRLLKKNPLDLQVLGIGSNGHIGFNEPGTPLGNETFVVTLDERTRKDNSRFFGSLDDVPKYAITMGIKNIMRAKELLLIASGIEKAEAVHQMIYGDVTSQLPASILQLHPNCTIILDEPAASKLKEKWAYYAYFFVRGRI